ncbi:MAG: enoyl-CoA hydratase [Terriglobia bacterium]|nr:MAG: enoyl-CoA hydratase [Terriglobia bacterium]
MADSIVSLGINADGIGLLRMHDERNRNSLSVTMAEALSRQLAAIAASESIKVVVIAGLPEYFCTGASEEVLADLVEHRIAPQDLVLPRWILDLPVPSIAAMEGHALGGGLALGMCADMIVAAEESRYGCTFMNMGFTPGMGTTRLLEHAISPAVAEEMLFTGKTFRGSELQGKCGLNYVLPRRDVLAKALALAAAVADKPRLALTLLKQSLSRSRKEIYGAALEEETRMHRRSLEQPGTRERIRNHFA